MKEYNLETLIESEVSKRVAAAAAPAPAVSSGGGITGALEACLKNTNLEKLTANFFSGARGLIQDYAKLVGSVQPPRMPTPSAAPAPAAAPAVMQQRNIADMQPAELIIMALSGIQNTLGDIRISQIQNIFDSISGGINEAAAALGDRSVSELLNMVKAHPDLTNTLIGSRIAACMQQAPAAAPEPAGNDNTTQPEIK